MHFVARQVLRQSPIDRDLGNAKSRCDPGCGLHAFYERAAFNLNSVKLVSFIPKVLDQELRRYYTLGSAFLAQRHISPSFVVAGGVRYLAAGLAVSNQSKEVPKLILLRLIVDVSLLSLWTPLLLLSYSL